MSTTDQTAATSTDDRDTRLARLIDRLERLAERLEQVADVRDTPSATNLTPAWGDERLPLLSEEACPPRDLFAMPTFEL